MNTCTVTTGFFALKRCGGMAVGQCQQCQRPVCAAHASPQRLCPECASAAGYARPPTDPSWARQYRRTFYSSTSRTYRDSSYFDLFDLFDRAAFGSDSSYYSDDSYDYDGDDGSVDS